MATPITVPPNTFFIPVNLSSSFKTFTLPVVSTNPGRMLIFKDSFGCAPNSSLRLSSIGMDRIERSTVSSIALSNGFGAWTFTNDGLTTWLLTDAYFNTLRVVEPSGPGLYAFTSHTFTNASATFQNGPILSACVSAYSALQPWVTNTAFFNMITQGIQLWTVPITGSYTFTVAGAQGGPGQNGSGLGALVTLTLSLTAGHILAIAIGQRGAGPATGCYGTDMGGGGGGTFVRNTTTSTWLVVAGGGGGGGTGSLGTLANASLTTSGNTGPLGNSGAGGTGGNGGSAGTGCVPGGAGGGGISTDGATSSGASGGKSFANGLVGGGGTVVGGFGGGGAVNQYGGGGGGGYSGGGGGGLPDCNCSNLGAGGGGGSFGIVSFTSSATTNTGQGYCTVVKV